MGTDSGVHRQKSKNRVCSEVTTAAPGVCLAKDVVGQRGTADDEEESKLTA